MTDPLSTEYVLPFCGYRRPRVGQFGFERGRPELYPSIEHFFQSEKFRGVDESFRQHLMELPTAREARKAALRRDNLIRPDWDLIQTRVMATGVWMQCQEHVSLRHQLTNRLDFSDLYTFKDHFWSSDRENVSAGFYARVLSGVKRRMARRCVRALITGSREFSNRFLFQTKIDSIFKRRKPDEVLVGCSKGPEDMAEAWAIENCLPVVHYPVRQGRSQDERMWRNGLLVNDATHLVVFAQGDESIGADTADLIELAECRKLPLRIIRLDGAGRLVRAPKNVAQSSVPIRRR